MSVPQKIVPHKGVNLDIDELYMSEAHAAFIKNITYNVNSNTNSGSGAGANELVFTPLQSNSKYCNLTLPEGRNFCIGYYESRELAEGYVFVHNSNNNHLIYRISGRTKLCQVVLQSSCLNFILDPKHFIAEGRCTLQTTSYVNKVTDTEEIRKYLIFTDDINPQRFISVEDSIATNGFNATQFPYFATTDPTCDRCNWFNLGIAPPMDCINIEPVKRDIDDDQEKTKANILNYKSWQFRVKFIDVWGRESEHGVISDMYISSTGSGCIADSNGLPRCLKLKFKAGCPFVDKIQIEFRNCNGNVRGLSVNTDWFLYDVINKWNDCGDIQWYNRKINNAYKVEYDRLIALSITPVEAAKQADGLLRYYANTNQFEYTFCGDKECSPIPVSQTNRGFNPLPITSGSVFPIAKNIGLARNRMGYEPLDCKELDKITYPVTPPPPNTCSITKYRKITVWAVIWNPFEDTYVPLRKDTGRNVFGIADCVKNNPYAFKQILPVGQEGFVGYLAGTKYFSVSKQYMHNIATGEDTLVNIPYTVPGGFLNYLNYIALQKFEFNVLPGKYVFRIAGHRSSPQDDYQKTSTYLKGQTDIDNLGDIVNENNELIIDVCGDDDFEEKENPMMIYDLTRIGKGCGVVEVTNVVEGYMREDEINKYPIELAKVDPNISSYHRNKTDHNGHYFAATRNKGLYVELYGQKECTLNQKLAKSQTSYDNSDTWYRYDELYAYKNLIPYPVGDRFLIKGRISLCDDHNIGVAGAMVIFTRGQFAYADVNGNFTIVAHDVGDVGARVDKVIVSQRGVCQLLSCATECVYCFADTDVEVPACTGDERVFNIADLYVKINGLNKRGPQMGGRYAIGQKLHDWMGRHTFVQGSDKHYVNIPTLQETQVYDYSTIGYNMDASIRYPSWVKYVSFYITENLANDDFLTWVTERIQFIDNTGKVNTAAPTQIRLYYESLNEYNKQNDYSTNTVWQFINSEDATVTGDQIEFLANGDGTIYNKRITALLKYNKEGKYISIDYTDELKDLKDGALIRFIRPKQCVNKDFYYELCPMIRVVDGVPVTLSGTFNFFDSYMQNRQIPVPIETKKTDETTGEIITTTDNEIKNFPFLFEHHSPSDLWGDHCWNKGRVNTKNPYENQQLLKTEIALSAALANNGVINGLNYFTDADRVIFEEQEWGGITCVLPELQNVLVICEHDNFVVGFNDSQVKVNEQGGVYAPSADNRFGRPQRKIGNNYGCEMDDINTIRRKDGLVLFVDRSKTALIEHNYSDAADVSTSLFSSWLKEKVKYIAAWNVANPANKKYLHSVIDPKENEYLLTSFNLATTANADTDFVNTERGIAPQLNETIAFDIYSKILKSFWAFTPEYFGSLEGDSFDNQLLSFRRGEAWKHHILNSPGTDFNVFYGTPTEWVLEVIGNMDAAKQKRYLWNEVYCREIKLYADRVMTEAQQVSRIMPKWWERREKFWTADFKCAINTAADNNITEETGVNALLDGDMLYGRWVKVRYVPHPDFIKKYFELTGVIINMNGSEKSGTK